MDPRTGHPGSSSSFSAKKAGRAGILFFLLAGALRASDLPEPATLDFPFPANLATPAWLGHPETPATIFATLNLPILTPDTTASLLVTIYFQEKQGGFLRITWKGTQGAQVLSENFYEDVGMANQRSLLISPATLVGDGTLIFQCGDSSLGIQRIKLEWLQSASELVSPQIHDLLVTAATGPTQTSVSLNGQANPAGAGAWQNSLVTVPMTDQAVRIEEGVEFSVALDAVPGSGRLALKEAGLPFGKHLVVWINEQRAGIITPAVPDLIDDGFLGDDNAATSYVGWRDGSFYVPVALLKTGGNTVQLSSEDDGAAAGNTSPPATGAEPLAVKDMVLQFNYAPAGKIGFLQPQLSLTPVDPIPPAGSSPAPAQTNAP